MEVISVSLSHLSWRRRPSNEYVSKLRNVDYVIHVSLKNELFDLTSEAKKYPIALTILMQKHHCIISILYSTVYDKESHICIYPPLPEKLFLWLRQQTVWMLFGTELERDSANKKYESFSESFFLQLADVVESLLIEHTYNWCDECKSRHLFGVENVAWPELIREMFALKLNWLMIRNDSHAHLGHDEIAKIQEVIDD